jgi:hypothetical protein
MRNLSVIKRNNAGKQHDWHNFDAGFPCRWKKEFLECVRRSRIENGGWKKSVIMTSLRKSTCADIRKGFLYTHTLTSAKWYIIMNAKKTACTFSFSSFFLVSTNPKRKGLSFLLNKSKKETIVLSIGELP